MQGRIRGRISRWTWLTILGLCMALAWVTLQSPRQVRTWSPEQSRLAQVSMEGPRVTINNVRDFPPDVPASDAVARYVKHDYDLDALDSVWFVLVPFSEAWRGPAHSFISFGFKDGRYLAVSIEGRREVGESYGMVAGLLRRFELIYVLGEERDLIGRRVAQASHDLYLYRINAQPEALRAAFLGVMNRAEGLRKTPEFYNTLLNNCTSNLIDHVNQVVPGKIRWDWRRLFPGYADEMALELGMIETKLTLEEARRNFRVNDRVREHLNAPDFSARIREL
jgi:Domain of unknown function (DUF4105)